MADSRYSMHFVQFAKYIKRLYIFEIYLIKKNPNIRQTRFLKMEYELLEASRFIPHNTCDAIGI